MMKGFWKVFFNIESYPSGHMDKIISGIGAFFGIFAIFYSSTYFVPTDGAYLIVASMGASAVLLFSVPHGPLSQPWNLIGGHLISALVGVACVKFIPNVFIAAPMAVGVAISAMYYFNCIHPPGGATALSAVVVTSVHPLGYFFILTPVLINVLAIISIAIVFNGLFHWRRYPVYLSQLFKKERTNNHYPPISHEDFVFALSQIDRYVDISEDEVVEIYTLATKTNQQQKT